MPDDDDDDPLSAETNSEPGGDLFADDSRNRVSVEDQVDTVPDPRVQFPVVHPQPSSGMREISTGSGIDRAQPPAPPPVSDVHGVAPNRGPEIGAAQAQHPATRAVVPAPQTELRLKSYANNLFSPDAVRELEKAISACRSDLIKRAIRAKDEVRGDVVSAHNVKTVAASPRRNPTIRHKILGMSANTILGAAFGSLVSLLVTPPPDGIKPLTIAILVAMVTLGTIGIVWQIMRED